MTSHRLSLLADVAVGALLSGSKIWAALAAIGLIASASVPARAEGSLDGRWFRPCPDVAARSKLVTQWLERPGGASAVSCFLLNNGNLLVLTGAVNTLVAVDLNRPDAEPQELLSLHEAEIEEFVAVNGKRYALLQAGDRGLDRKSWTHYLLYLVPARGPESPVKVVELWSSRYFASADNSAEQEGRSKEKATHRLRSGPSTFVEVELDDAERLSIRELLLYAKNGKVSALTLKTQFDDLALSFQPRQGSPEFEPVRVDEFTERLKRRIPSAVVRSNVP